MHHGQPGTVRLPSEQVRAATVAVRLAIAVAVMALSAQVAVPLPFTPVPMTLQPIAVLAIGALLGPLPWLGSTNARSITTITAASAAERPSTFLASSRAWGAEEFSSGSMVPFRDK